LCNISNLTYVDEKPEGSIPFAIKSTEFFVPMGDNINKEEELEKLQKELEHAQKFLFSVNKQLSNERFVNNAPEKIIAMEKKKKADAEARIAVLEAQMSALK